jgi:2'-5' RNA ligase
MTLRLFLAIPLPPDVAAALDAAVRPLRHGDVGWTKVEQLHVTTRFLGELQPGPALGPAMAEIGAPRLVVRGGGSFPSRRRPRVLWAGVDGPLDGIVAAQDRALGLPTDRFHAHVTLGRVRRPGPVPDVSVLGEIGAWVAPALVLYRSVLARGGAVHTVEATFPFRLG